MACDKIYSKILAEYLDIPTAKWIIADKNESMDEVKRRAESAIGFPMFIKPATLGSSIGIFEVNNESDLLPALDGARKFCDRILIEKKIDLQFEIECAILSLADKILISTGGRIFTDGKFYSYERKYSATGSPTATHVSEESDYSNVVRDYALRLATHIPVRHLARIDFFLSRDGRVIFNEINTIPGMTATSLYPLLTTDMGLAQGEFINLLLREVTG